MNVCLHSPHLFIIKTRVRTTVTASIFVSFLIIAFTCVASAAQVLIVQDKYPWGSSAIQTVLAANSIAFDQISSSQIGTADFSSYEMIVIPSDQDTEFYPALNVYINKFEEYVREGGKLWQSTCNQVDATEPMIPGGVVSSTDFNAYDSVIDSGHPWIEGVPETIYGDSASHDSFTFLYPGSTVIAIAESSGRPVLVDYRYGAGRILISGMTLEYAWQANWDAKPILENSLVELFGSRDAILIIQDRYPWSSWISGGMTSIQDILTMNGIRYDQLASAQIGTSDLSSYAMIIVPSLQGESFYANWNANIGLIESFVWSGGKLWQSFCNESTTATEPLMPGNVVGATDISFYNLIQEAGHPWVQGVQNPIYGNGASHDSLLNLYPDSRVIATSLTSGRPVLVDYNYGEGRVLVTGQTLEYAWNMGDDAGPILENSLLDMLDPKKPFPWNLFLPAILMGTGQNSQK